MRGCSALLSLAAFPVHAAPGSQCERVRAWMRASACALVVVRMLVSPERRIDLVFLHESLERVSQTPRHRVHHGERVHGPMTRQEDEGRPLAVHALQRGLDEGVLRRALLERVLGRDDDPVHRTVRN